jgi:hypothetical protein
MVYPSAIFLDAIGCGICVWVDLFSPAVISYRTNLQSFKMLSWLVI